jgi:hypothetical protein
MKKLSRAAEYRQSSGSRLLFSMVTSHVHASIGRTCSDSIPGCFIAASSQTRPAEQRFVLQPKTFERFRRESFQRFHEVNGCVCLIVDTAPTAFSTLPKT